MKSLFVAVMVPLPQHQSIVKANLSIDTI